MLKTLKKTSPVMAGLFMLILTACPGGNPPTTTNPGTGTDVASISGTVTKADGTPADNATVVLIKRESNQDSDAQIVRTGGNGLYSFSKVNAGNYRVAFVIQTEQERKDGTPIAYNPAEKTGQYFGAITTKNFDYDGVANKTFQVPSFNVGWVSTLSPHNSSVDFNSPVNITWAAPKTSATTEYNVLIKDSNDNPFYKSVNGSNTSFSFVPADTKGNQGSNTGKSFEKGKLYYYIVNATFNNAGMSEPAIAYGNTPNANFTIK